MGDRAGSSGATGRARRDLDRHLARKTAGSGC